VHLFYMNVNDYVIADTVFGSPVLWVSERIFMDSYLKTFKSVSAFKFNMKRKLVKNFIDS